MCPHIFCVFLYSKGMLKQKHVNAILYLLFFMSPQYGVHGALKECKSRKYFYDFFNVGIGK
jgi:hypothetical protein